MRVRTLPQRSRPRRGFTLMEMLVVVAIIVVLAGIGGYFLLGASDQAKMDAARVQARGTLTKACQTYYLKHNTWPPNLQALLVADGMGGPYLEDQDAMIDPWGKVFQYDPNGTKNNGRKPDIWSGGPNGSAQIGNWSVH